MRRRSWEARITLRHRIVAGGCTGRRPVLAAALLGLVLAGAGLVPAIAADHGSGSKDASGTEASGTADRLVVEMKKPISRDAEDSLAASVGGRHGGRIRPGVFAVDVPQGQAKTLARQLKRKASVAHAEPDVRFRSAAIRRADTVSPDPLVPSSEATASGEAAAPPPKPGMLYTTGQRFFSSLANDAGRATAARMRVGRPWNCVNSLLSMSTRLTRSDSAKGRAW